MNSTNKIIMKEYKKKPMRENLLQIRASARGRRAAGVMA